MRIFEKVTNNIKALVFLDLEGTQHTGEVIEIGASLAVLNKDGSVKSTAKPFRRFVKAHSRIGKIVEEMTGITQKKLNTEGITFAHAISEFHDYVGKYWDNALFVTFGNGDRHMLGVSYELNREAPKIYLGHIQKRNWDLGTFLSYYIKDEHGNSYSLTNFLKLFDISFSGHAHDAYSDARNLQTLYEAARSHPQVFVDHYQAILSNPGKLPAPIAKVVKKLSNGEDVTSKEYRHYIEETFE